MVLTIEPGLYVPADLETVDPGWRGIGIRIEDDVLVTEDGRRVLSEAVPKAVADIEALRG
jgi:Xaa-Pro aminopeptidase